MKLYELDNFLHNEELKDIRPLLYKDKPGSTVRGPMSPLLAAKELGKNMSFKWNHLARITFRNIEQGDWIAMVMRSKRVLAVGIFIDLGAEQLPVAVKFSDEKEPTITPVYENYEFESDFDNIILDEDCIDYILNYIIDNPECYMTKKLWTEETSK